METPTPTDRTATPPNSPMGSSTGPSDSTVLDHEEKEWIRRPSVRIGIYLFLVLFLLVTIGYGIVPRVMDPDFEEHINNKNVMVGMSRDQVLKAWGAPLQTNVTYTNEGVRREEWVYEEWKSSSDIRHRYLYFEEGLLIGGWY